MKICCGYYPVDNVDNSVDNAFEVALFDKKRVKKRTWQIATFTISVKNNTFLATEAAGQKPQKQKKTSLERLLFWGIKKLWAGISQG